MRKVLVPVDELQVDDVYVVRPGEKLPADGVIVEGASALDQSLLTGESVPIEVQAVRELKQLGLRPVLLTGDSRRSDDALQHVRRQQQPAPAPFPQHAHGRSIHMSQTAEKRTYGYHADKQALVKGLHRIEGQVSGVEKMLEDDRYCIDVLTQISAVSTALESGALEILDDHVNHCVAHALASGDQADAETKTRELLEAVQRFARMR